MMKDAVKIGSDLKSFLFENSEVKILERGEKIKSITIPDDAIVHCLIVFDGILYDLDYSYNGLHKHYQKQEEKP